MSGKPSGASDSALSAATDEGKASPSRASVATNWFRTVPATADSDSGCGGGGIPTLASWWANKRRGAAAAENGQPPPSDSPAEIGQRSSCWLPAIAIALVCG